MESKGLQKSQFLNSLANWEILGGAAYAYIDKIQFSIFFLNLEKLGSPSRATFKNP